MEDLGKILLSAIMFKVKLDQYKNLILAWSNTYSLNFYL